MPEDVEVRVKPLSFIPTSSVSVDELARYFGSAFEGYIYPQNMSGAQMARKIRMEQIDLDHSLLAFDVDTFVGIALLGIRGNEGWCGGLGVVPEHRSSGRGSEITSRFIDEARNCGCRRLTLEVLTSNQAAKRLYENAGFGTTRDLVLLERADRVNTSAVQPDEVAALDLLSHFERLHDSQPPWQRDLASLLATEGARGFYVGRLEAPDAYAIVVSRVPGLTHIIDLAAKDKENAVAICGALDSVPGPVRIVNEPEESVFVGELLTRGFVEVDRQHEMELVISP
jgi:GNAT superfamily N-acetyltransferase